MAHYTDIADVPAFVSFHLGWLRFDVVESGMLSQVQRGGGKGLSWRCQLGTALRKRDGLVNLVVGQMQRARALGSYNWQLDSGRRPNAGTGLRPYSAQNQLIDGASLLDRLGLESPVKGGGNVDRGSHQRKPTIGSNSPLHFRAKPFILP